MFLHHLCSLHHVKEGRPHVKQLPTLFFSPVEAQFIYPGWPAIGSSGSPVYRPGNTHSANGSGLCTVLAENSCKISRYLS